MFELFENLGLGDNFDETFDHEGRARDAYQSILHFVNSTPREELLRRARLKDQVFRDEGITFSLSGTERPFPLDLLPRIISAEEWLHLEAGIVQRVRALDAFLDDVYGGGEILKDDIVPAKRVLSSHHFHREAFGLQPQNGVRIHLAGIDLVRDDQGEMRVLEDNVRIPSGASYVVENRKAMAHLFPEIFASYSVRAVSGYPLQLLNALRASGPAGIVEPNIVVMTPGMYNSAYFEHSFLARQMGIELVEGRDLICRNQKVYLKTTAGEMPVHVIYRRVDDEFLDPLHFRPDSLIGCPGLLNSARAGNVTIANAVGNGVADDKAIYPYVPKMIEYYLGEKSLLKDVATFDLEIPCQLAEALERREELVFKPADGSGGYGIVIGPTATDGQLQEVTTALKDNPRGWVAQELVNLSTLPTWTGESFGPRHVDLRPFAINTGGKISVLPGGLTRVALVEGSMIVNSSQGGGSKDTWVLAPSKGEQDDFGSSTWNPPSSGAKSIATLTGPGLTDVVPRHMQELQQQQAKSQPGTDGDHAL